MVDLSKAVPGALMMFSVGLWSGPARPAPAEATETWRERLQVHGFLSQALVVTDANRWFGNSPQTSFEFTEIGLNASLRATPRLLLAGQVLVRNAGAMYDGTPTLDYALADLSLVMRPEQRLGLRLGRLKNPLGLYNETRDVPFTRPGIFLPQVIYWDRVRNLMLSSDGAMLYGETYHDFGSLSLSLTHGRSVIDTNVEWAYLNNDFPGDIALDGVPWSASFWFATPTENLRLGLSAAKFDLRFKPNRRARLTLQPGRTNVTYLIASAQYNAERWTLSAEYARQPIRWRDYGPLFPDRNATGEGYYVQGAYRLRPDLELMMRYEQGFADANDRSGRRLEAASGGLVPAHTAYSHIFTTGVRWDLSRAGCCAPNMPTTKAVSSVLAAKTPTSGVVRNTGTCFRCKRRFGSDPVGTTGRTDPGGGPSPVLAGPTSGHHAVAAAGRCSSRPDRQRPC